MGGLPLFQFATKKRNVEIRFRSQTISCKMAPKVKIIWKREIEFGVSQI